MARFTFGGTSGDSVTQPPQASNPVARFVLNANATGTFWSTQTGSTQYVDLLDAATGVAITGLSTDQFGRLRQFRGPDGVMSGWVDFGAGRFFVAAYDGVFTTGDSNIAGYVGTAGSATRNAIDARWAKITASATTWAPSTSYAAGQAVINPSGDLVTAKTAHTSGTSYTAANWNLSPTYVQHDANTVNVRDHGVKGDGSTDDTAAINSVIQSFPGRVILFPVSPLGLKTFMVNATANTGAGSQPTGIQLNQPGTKLLLEGGVTIQAITNASDHYSIVQVTAADCMIEDGTIKGDVSTHTGTTGEWGHGVDVNVGADRFRVIDTVVRECWGDGVIIGGATAPKDVGLYHVVSDSNRRQGCSITGAIRPQIIGGAYINTGSIKATAPSAGIDVEPNANGVGVTDFVITGVTMNGNAGPGLQLVTATAAGCTGVASGNVITGNTGWGVNTSMGGPSFDVRLSGNRVTGNTAGQVNLAGVTGIRASMDAISYTPTLTAATTSPTNWTVTGWYSLTAEGFCDFEFEATAQSTFTAGSGIYSISLPVIDVNLGQYAPFAGAVLAGASGTNNTYPVMPSRLSGGKVSFMKQTGAFLDNTGPTSPSGTTTAWASGGFIRGHIRYRYI